MSMSWLSLRVAAAVVPIAIGAGASACFALIPDNLEIVNSDSALPDAADASVDCSVDFYVDSPLASGADAALLSQEPVVFTTIGAALNAAAMATCEGPKTVYLGEGVYDRETFPLELRGVRLVGLGPQFTTISGMGPVPNLTAPSQVAANRDPVEATLVVGSETETTEIRDLAIAPGPQAKAMPGTEAVVCDRGDGATDTAASPRTLLTNVAIASFEIGVRLAPSSGCSMRLADSSISNGSVGVFAGGVAGRPVSTQIVGTSFDDLRISPPAAGEPGATPRRTRSGAGVEAFANVVGITVQTSRFLDSDRGLFVDATGTSQGRTKAEIDQNTIGPLTNQGALFAGPLDVNLVGNVIYDVSGPTAEAGLMVAIRETSLPIVHARANHIFSNQNGVEIRDESNLAAILDDVVLTDFGTASDPGKNELRCNVVADVAMTMGRSVGPIPFVGNIWDHATPTTGSGLGVDLQLTNVTVDTSDSSMATTPCGAFRSLEPTSLHTRFTDAKSMPRR